MKTYSVKLYEEYFSETFLRAVREQFFLSGKEANLGGLMKIRSTKILAERDFFWAASAGGRDS